MAKARLVENVHLTHRQANAAAQLLGVLQTHLEGAIEICLLPGETEPAEKIDKYHVDKDRRAWRDCEDLIIVLTNKRKRPRPGP